MSKRVKVGDRVRPLSAVSRSRVGEVVAVGDGDVFGPFEDRKDVLTVVFFQTFQYEYLPEEVEVVKPW